VTSVHLIIKKVNLSLSLYLCLLVCKEVNIKITYTDDDDDPSWISAGFCSCFFIFLLLTFLRYLN
jgi:hypothetical protein